MDKKLLILKIFLKHIKRYHMYTKFRCSINQGAMGEDLYHTILRNNNAYRYTNMRNSISRMHSPFIFCKNLTEILKKKNKNVGEAKIEDTTSGQTQIMNIVNLLIHSCIEYAITSGDMRILEKIGNDVFNDVCKSLFGEDFTDKTAKMDGNGQMPNVLTMDALKNMIGGDISKRDLSQFLKTLQNSVYGNYGMYYMDYPNLSETYITNNH